MTTAPAPRAHRTDLLFALLGAVLMLASLFVVPASSDPARDCDERVNLAITVSTEKVALVATVAADYEGANRAVDGVCAGEISVAGLTSGKAMNALAKDWRDLPDRPQVWLPTSSMWLRLLEHRAATDKSATDPTAAPLGSVTASTLVIAMPRDAADALKEARAPLETWADVLRLADEGWASYGQPEWDKFLLGRDNPDVSTSGLAATVATYHAAPGEISADAMQNANVISFVHGIESSVARYGDEAVDFMKEIYAKEQDGVADDAYRPYIDAVVIQEQMTYAYNCGTPEGDPGKMASCEKPARPMTVVHPRDGTLLLDHPFVPLANASPQQRAVAGDFYEFLREDAQQQRFRGFGFRDPDQPHRPTGELAEILGLPADQKLSFVTPPSAELLAAMLANWNNVKKKVRVLLVLDVSESMKDEVDDPDTADDPTKLELLKPAARQAVDLLAGDDEIGLWTFDSTRSERYPITSVSLAREQVKGAIDALTPQGNTALYSTTDAAHEAMTADLASDRINAVVLLSDGKNTQGYGGKATNAEALEVLLGRLNPAGRDTSVRIFTIAYGKDAPVAEFNRIAQVTKAVSVDATDPLDIGRAFVAVFENFG